MTIPPAVLRQAAGLAALAEQAELLRTRFADCCALQRGDQRGYLSPDEDELILACWADWWRTRCALLDIVQEQRARFERSDAPHAEFTVGFAAALVLLDNARWLYRAVHSRRVLRRALNEAQPPFAIPARAYEQIVRGMTRLRHVFIMRRAIAWFEREAAALSSLNSEPALAACLGLIEQHAGAVEVGRRRLLLTHMRVKARRVASAIRRRGLRPVVYGVHEALGCAVAEIRTVPDHRPHLPDAVLAELRERLQPGDVLITRKEHALSNHLLPGHWPHAILYLGSIAELSDSPLAEHASWSSVSAVTDAQVVLEAQKDGVRLRGLISAADNDAVCILRPRLPREQVYAALQRGLAHCGKPYDFFFDFSTSQRLVCSEVVYRAYCGVGPVQWPLRERVGRQTLAPQDLLAHALARDHLDLVAMYTHVDGWRDGAEAVAAVRATLAGSW